MKDAVLQIEGLSLRVRSAGSTASERTLLTAEVECRVDAGQMTAMVGESGSGKTLTALAAIGLLPPSIERVGGSILIAGQRCEHLSAQSWRALRGRVVSMIFQEPMSALDPVFSVGDLLREVLALDGLRGRRAVQMATSLLEEVKIPDPDRCLHSMPHMLSGGMCQRVVIALALARNPALILADEPTTALDAVTREAVMDLLGELQLTRGLGILLISHDLGLVANRAQRVVVLHGGRVCECGPSPSVFGATQHPYTRGLLNCRLPLDRRAARLSLLEDVLEDPSAWEPICTPEGPRRPWWPARGSEEGSHPQLVEVGPEHFVAAEC